MASHFASLPLNFNQAITNIPATSRDPEMALSGTPGHMIDENRTTFWQLDAATGGIRFNLGSSVAFDAFYIVSANLGNHTVKTVTFDESPPNARIEETHTSGSAPKTVSGAAATASDVQYAFYSVAEATEAHVDFQWTSRVDNAAPVRIYEFYVLKLLFSVAETDGFQQINQDYTFRGSQIQEALDGTRTRTRPLGNHGKWRIAYAMNMLSDTEAKILKLNDFFAMHPNFTHIVDFPTHPDRVFQAYLADEVRYRYLSTFRGAGSVAQFTIEEA